MPRRIKPIKKKLLRVEALEPRCLLSGVVNVFTNPPGPAPPVPINANAVFPTLPAVLPTGDLLLQNPGLDFDANQIDIQSTGIPGQYLITPQTSTQLRVNGGAPVGTAQTVDGVFGNIFVNLGAGGDTFRFLPESLTADSTVPQSLYVITEFGDTIEIGEFDALGNSVGTTGVDIDGILAVGGTAAGGSTSTLRVGQSDVNGFTVVRNPVGPSITKLVDSAFDSFGSPGYPGLGFPVFVTNAGHNPPATFAGGEGAAFALTNGGGLDLVSVLGTTTFGLGTNIPPAPGTAAVTMNNGAGGVWITFGPENADDTTRVQVHGGLEIRNLANVVNNVDTVSLDRVDVTGRFVINNDGGLGGGSVMVTNSNLGTNPTQPANTAVVVSRAGPDQFTMTDSTALWGLVVDHDVFGVDNRESTVQITGGAIGSFGGGVLPIIAPGHAPALIGRGYVPGATALFVGGSRLGDDTVNVSGTTFGGPVRVELFNGDNSFSMADGGGAATPLVVPALFYNATANAGFLPFPTGPFTTFGTGQDWVVLTNISTPLIRVYMGAGIDTLELRGNTTLPSVSWPVCILDFGGPGTNNLAVDTGVFPTFPLGLVGTWTTIP